MSINQLVKRDSYTTWLSITIGLSDGLIVPFAIIAGLRPVMTSMLNIGLIGLMACAGGAIVMSFGGYYSILSAQGDKAYKARMDLRTDEILKHLEMQEYIGKEIEHSGEAEEEAKVQALQNEILQQGPVFHNPVFSSIIIGIAYLFGGVIVVLPFLVMSAPNSAFISSGIIVFSLLLLLGLIKSRYAAKKPLELILRLWLITAFAAGGTYTIASLFMR